MWPHYDCGRGNEFQKSTLNDLIYLNFSPFAPQVNETENKLAMEMSKVDNRSLSEFEIFHEKLETILHPQHYLMIMLKRHLVQLYSGVLAQLDDEDLERVALHKFSFREGFKKSKWKFKMTFAIRGPTPPSPLNGTNFQTFFLPHFFSFAIESYIYETDFTLQKYHF